jgi:hypothetical protein
MTNILKAKPLTALLFATAAVAGVGALIAHALSGNARQVGELAGVIGGASLIVYMVRHRVGPLDLLIRLLIWKQAVLLGVREELAGAWFSLLENHAERMQRVKARHAGTRI